LAPKEDFMRKIVVSTIVSLDGVQDNPQNWSHHFWDEEHGQKASEILFAADVLLMGRVTYEGFAAAWTKRSGDPFTDRINAMPKYVASSSLSGELPWNASVLKGELVTAVNELRNQDGGDILMYGCGPVSKQLMQNGLIDELKLWYNPVFAGEGEQVYGKSADLPIMDLVKAEPMQSGIVIITYRPRNMAG
jgi:dihydrofolate reductase